MSTAETSLAPQLLAGKKRRRRRLVAAGVAAVVAVGLAVAAKPSYRAVKGWRARQMALAAEALTGQEKWADALAKARAAYQLRPEEPAAIRAVAHLQNAVGNPAAAVPFWKELEGARAMTAADRRRYAEDLFRTGAREEAGPQLDRVLAAQPDDAVALRLAARMAAARRSYGPALELARRAADLEPASGEGRLLLALLEFDTPGSAQKEAGLQALLRLAQEREKTGLEALEYLARKDGLTGATAEQIIPLLKAHPLATEAHRLLALELELKAQPAQREALLERKAAECTDAAAQRSFGVWLNAQREFARTLRLIPRAAAMQRKDLLQVHLDALGGLKRWSEIEEILGQKGVPLDEVFVDLFLARSAMELGHTTKAALHWHRAHLAAAPSPEQMWVVGSYAEKVGQTDEAEQAYRSLTASAKTARPAFEALLRLAERKGDTAALLALLREMRARWPNDAAVENDGAFLSLLRGQDLAAGLASAQRLVALAPRSLPHRTTLALAWLRAQQPERALAVYDRLEIPWERAAPAQRAVHAAVLGANGQADAARAEAQALRAEALRAEERALLAPWL